MRLRKIVVQRVTVVKLQWGRLKMREWKMLHGQNCKGGKCRSSLAVDGQLNLECKERQR